ncbi:MAG TPA: serine protease [Candidatus Sulfotelmatobacter sp.]|nr:serine protease [Candidatus Sulfotelmatobacter sp.]
MRTFTVQILGAVLLTTVALAASPRFVIDDDEYLQKVTDAGAKLLQEHKLQPLKTLRTQVHTKGYRLKLAPLSRQKFDAPDLYDRLRESTLAVGIFYKCPDCEDWHFNSSGGFVVSEGVVSTCCHVILAQDKGVREAYLVAADATGRVFPVQSVLAADTESDTCFLKVNVPGLKPLPLRPGIRTGERVYCLSHPGGYHFMFTQGLVARVNRLRNEVLDELGQTNGLLTRPILFLNITAEFAPGSSGGPIVDEAGNVVGQVASIADAGDPGAKDENTPPSPSVPVRFCTASEELLHLADPRLKPKSPLEELKAHSPAVVPGTAPLPPSGPPLKTRSPKSAESQP